MTFEEQIIIEQRAEKLFAITQDYDHRLEWDPYLRRAELVGDAQEAGVGVRAWCVSRAGLGMETEYVSYQSPRRAAVKMTRGPWLLKRFAGSWVFDVLAPTRTRVRFRYHVRAVGPAWLSKALTRWMSRGFARNMRKRLISLKRFAEAA